MKTNYLIILSIVSFIALFSCNKPEDTPSDTPETVDTIAEKLMKYSWVQCEIFTVLLDSSIYDLSSNLIVPDCKLVHTYSSYNVFYSKGECDVNPWDIYWYLDNENSKIQIYYDSLFTDLESTYKILKLTGDSLKVFVINSNSPEEFFIGNYINFYSKEKEQY